MIKKHLPLLAILIIYAVTMWWRVDDAFIYAEYGKNLANGFGLVFHPAGDPVAAFSGILYPLIMAFYTTCFINSVTGMQVTSILVYIAGGWMLWKYSTKETRGIIVLLYVFPLMWVHVVSGLETVNFGVLLMWNFYSMFISENRRVNGIALSLLALCRFDGVAVGMVFLFWYIIIRIFIDNNPDKIKRDIKAIVFYLIALIGIASLFLFYYQAMPTSWQVKGSLNYVFILSFAFFAISAFFSAVSFSRREMWGAIAIGLSVAVMIFSTYMFSKPMMNYSWRFYVQYLPLGLIILGQTRPHVLFRAVAIVALVWYFPASFAHEYNFIKDYKKIDKQLELVAVDIDSMNYDDIVAVDVGQLGYRTDAEIIDLVGLVTPELIHGDKVKYFFNRLPDAVLFPSYRSDRFQYHNKWGSYDIVNDVRFEKLYYVKKVYKHESRTYVLWERRDFKR